MICGENRVAKNSRFVARELPVHVRTFAPGKKAWGLYFDRLQFGRKTGRKSGQSGQIFEKKVL